MCDNMIIDSNNDVVLPCNGRASRYGPVIDQEEHPEKDNSEK